MDQKQAAADFVKKLEDLIQPHIPGKMKIEPGPLADLIRSDPESATAVTYVYNQMGAEGKPRYFQIALALGVVYQQVTGDDCLARMVERTMKKHGATEKPSVIPDPAAPPQPEPMIHLEVTPENLANQDIYWLVKMLAPDHQKNEAERRGLADFRDRCALSFTVNDPRDVSQIPEVRAFMTKLHRAMPYLPYYLLSRPGSNFKLMYFQCLADLDAYDANGQMDLFDDRVFEFIVESMRSLAVFCPTIGVDVGAAQQDVAAGLVPAEYVGYILQAI